MFHMISIETSRSSKYSMLYLFTFFLKVFSFWSNRMKNSELYTKKKTLFEEPLSVFCGHFSKLKAFDIYLRFFRAIPYKFMTPSGIFWSCLCLNFKYFGGKINITCLPKGYSLYLRPYKHWKTCSNSCSCTVLCNWDAMPST